MEKITAYIGLLLMLIGFMLLVISVNRGKRIVEYLKQRYPQQWEDMGKPEPGYLNSASRTRWFQFILKAEYLEYNDSRLHKMGNAQRKLESGTLIFLLVFILVFGGIAVWIKFF